MGIAGTLLLHTHPEALFIDKTHQVDEEILKHRRGSNTGQQAFEGLAILAALRLWSSVWSKRRCTLSVRSDSVSALTLLLRFKTVGDGPAVIARELALDVAAALYAPNVVKHLPGVANVVADVLSRWYEPGKPQQVPSLLRHAERCRCPARPEAWWRSRARLPR